MSQGKVSELVAKWERTTVQKNDVETKRVFGGQALPAIHDPYASTNTVPMAEVVPPPSPPEVYHTTTNLKASAPRSEPVRRSNRFDINKYIGDRSGFNDENKNTPKYVSTPSRDREGLKVRRRAPPEPSAPPEIFAPSSLPTKTYSSRFKETITPLSMRKTSSPPSSKTSPKKRALSEFANDGEESQNICQNTTPSSPEKMMNKSPEPVKTPLLSSFPPEVAKEPSYLEDPHDQSEIHPEVSEKPPLETLANLNNISRQETVNPYGQAVVLSAGRKCRDIICLLTFMVTLIALIAMTIVAAKNGDLAALHYGLDYRGRLCGSCGYEGDEATCGKPYLIINPSIEPFVHGVCVEECPQPGDKVCPADANTTVADCWETFVEHKPLINRCIPITRTKDVCLESPYLTYMNKSLPESADDPLCGVCLDPVFESDGIRPKDPSAQNCRAKTKRSQVIQTKELLHPALQELVSWSESTLQSLRDIHIASGSIATASAVAFVGSSVWMAVLIVVPNSLVWTTITIVFLFLTSVAVRLLIAGGLFPQTKFPDLTHESDGETVFIIYEESHKETLAIIGWMLLAFSLLLSVLACNIRNSMGRMSKVMRNIAKIVVFHPILLWVPLVSSAFILGAFWWSVIVVALLASVTRIDHYLGENDLFNQTNNNSSNRSYEEVNSTLLHHVLFEQGANPFLLAFVIFAAIWLLYTIRALASLTLSASIASVRYKEYPRVGICKAFYLMLRFHIGSAAFGSLVVAILRLLRALLSWMDRTVKRINNEMRPHERRRGQRCNCCNRALLALLTCCVNCFGGFFRYATRFSYVVVAVKGEPFCPATKSALNLLSSSMFDSSSSLFLMESAFFFGRMLVVCLSSITTWALLYKEVFSNATDLSSFLAPIGASAALAWLISGACFDLYTSTMDTLLICRLDIRKRKEAMLSDEQANREISLV